MIDFIDNKELKLRPSPFQYKVEFNDHGKESISKFRTVTMGGASLNSKHDRFKDFNSKSVIIRSHTQSFCLSTKKVCNK